MKAVELLGHAPRLGDGGAVVVVVAEHEVDRAIDVGGEPAQVIGEGLGLADVAADQDGVDARLAERGAELGLPESIDEVEVDIGEPGELHWIEIE